jgi:acyl-CoA synthetase (AMP-forming)/AMP-acid ligase II
MLPGTKLVQLYGTTERGFLTGLEDRDGSAEQLLNSRGRPCPDIDVQVRDPSPGAPLAPGQCGELVARGANIMLGYWIRTGDIGCQDATGDFFILSAPSP